MTREARRPLHRLTPLRDDPVSTWLTPPQSVRIAVAGWFSWAAFGLLCVVGLCVGAVVVGLGLLLRTDYLAGKKGEANAKNGSPTSATASGPRSSNKREEEEEHTATAPRPRPSNKRKEEEHTASGPRPSNKSDEYRATVRKAIDDARSRATELLPKVGELQADARALQVYADSLKVQGTI